MKVTTSGEPLPPLVPYSPLVLAAAGFGVVNLFFLPLVSSLDGPEEDGGMFLISLAAGPLVAQFGILPAWLVWGERPFWQRLAIHWSLAAGLALAWIVGLVLAANDSMGPLDYLLWETFCVFLCSPVVSLGVETPLWFTRFILGWRLHRTVAAATARRPLAIRDFLWGMAVISAALAAVRAAAAASYGNGGSEMWLGVAIAAGFACLASLLVMPLFAWGILRAQVVGNGIAIIVAFTIVAGMVIIGVVTSMMGRPPPSGEPFAALFLFLGSTAASIAGALGLARAAGYRLVIESRNAAATDGTNP
ncbi:MAG TPA: hypothetical protein VMP01_09470 [Pirellulaceae bacterium]|nr:hypothetical protein [Pirellulaceae bacterium]